ncbi:hypothetical protein GYA28_02320 [Candidatus Roizmanbacteria bacterium]|jgi:hypothetical protein|nr:hypothetical protein [Candidatus Roizmanbacteria bacterium]
MKNFVIGAVSTIIVLAVGFFSYQYGKKARDGSNNDLSVISVTPQVKVSSDTPLLGGDRDEHGCIGSAGYQWCKEKNKCLRSWEEACDDVGQDDTELIKNALIDKHDWNKDDIVVTVSKNDGKYASGGVREKNSEVGGGYFFAVKAEGGWKIVADGNGVIQCSSLAPYPDYPKSLISECYDETTGKNIVR